MGKRAVGKRIRAVVVCLVALGVLSTGAARGAPSSSAPRASYFALDMGPYMTAVNDRLSQSGDYKSKVSTLAGFFRARKSIGLFSGIQWVPSIGALVPWRSGADGFAKTFLIHSGLGFGVTPLSWLHVRFGPGLLWRLTITNSEQLNLNNGTSTSAFYTPGGSRSVFLMTADFGLDFRFFHSWSLGFDVWMIEVMNSQRRSINAAATIGFYL
jgi:hypothetical protein